MDIQWRKSSFSEQTDNCLELASHSGDILIRESDEPTVVIKATPAKLRALLAFAYANH